MKHLKRNLIIGGVGLAAVIGGSAFVMTAGGHRAHDALHEMHMRGGGMGHDEANMPGLRGANATEAETEELAVMFRGFASMTREVTNLPNGIRTLTSSSDPAVMERLVSHVVGMIGRVDAGDDPEIVIQSPTLDIFFVRGDAITSEIDVTDEGILVTQTSDDDELVEALQLHAGEVSAMAERGMDAVHEMMATHAGN